MRLVVLALMLSGCSGAASVAPSVPPTVPPTAAAASVAPSPEAHAVLGVVSVPGIASLGGFNGCDADDPGLSDVVNGSNATIKNESGVIIGAATLKIVTLGGSPSPCRFAFATMLPHAAFYHVVIGNHDGPTISYADLATTWRWELTLP